MRAGDHLLKRVIGKSERVIQNPKSRPQSAGPVSEAAEPARHPPAAKDPR
jgi:hypothetical protein